MDIWPGHRASSLKPHQKNDIVFDDMKRKKTTKATNIEKIKKRFRREWLLIQVKDVDERSTTPLTGWLLSHSPHRHDIYHKLLSLKWRDKMLVEYSEDTLPKGMIAAFPVRGV